MIRLNKPKKDKLDSARRSRIKQLNEDCQLQLTADDVLPMTKAAHTTTYNNQKGNVNFAIS